MKKYILSTMLGLALVSCTGSQPQSGSVASNGEEIFGGQNLSAGNPISHYLAAVWSTGENGQRLICTGISIQPQIILTAAHCTLGSMSSMKVVFSANANETDDSKARSVTAIKIPTHFNHAEALQTPGYFYDIALLKLDRPAPAGTLQMQLPDASVDVSTLSKVNVAGYGATSFDSDNGQSQGLTLQLRMALEPTHKATRDNVLQVDQSTGKGVCVGDSGGPAFAPSGKGYVVLGTLIDLDISSGEACRGLANFSDTTKWIDWIQGNSFILMQNCY